MSFEALVYAYVIGGVTFVPLVLLSVLFITLYTSVPVGDSDVSKPARRRLEDKEPQAELPEQSPSSTVTSDLNDLPRTRKGWLTMRRTFEESTLDGSYVTLVRSFLDARSKDPKRSRPKDMWYVVLKGKVLFLYEDETMTECEAAVELGSHEVVIYPEDLLDGELFAKRHAICLKPRIPPSDKVIPSLTKEMKLTDESPDDESSSSTKSEKAAEAEKIRAGAREQAFNVATPWFIFVRSNTEMEDWYLALIHASNHPANFPTLAPLRAIFEPADMNHLVSKLDEQPDVIPMRWLNALIGRLFFSYYRTHALETFIIGRLMKKLSKVKRPAFLTDIVVKEVSVGNKPPTFSKPMLKELTKEGDAAVEVHLYYKGEVRITVEATATINLGARFKSYTVKLVLAAVLKELEGNLLIKVKRPPSNRLWYAFTQTPKMTLEVEPIVSDRQITWGMILSTIESRLKEIIQESVVMPNMDDIAFFESAQHERRGGIWPDASRHKREPESLSDVSPELFSTISTDEQDVANVPSIAVAPSSPPRSRSAEELKAEPDSPPSIPVLRAATVSGGESTSASADIDTISRLSDIGNAGGNRPESPAPVHEEEQADPAVQARRKSTSQPDLDGENRLPETSAPRAEESDVCLSSATIRRSPSQTSLSTLSRSQSRGDTSLLDQSAASPNSHKPSRSINNASTTASSLLSTLKARAGDKEALSKSAKEAMRKWGVNWAGLRRDSQDRSDDAAVQDTSDYRTRTESGTLAQKARASYAEVRAAVAEWREREIDSRLRSESISAPDTILNTGKAQRRSASYGTPGGDLVSQSSSTVIPDSSDGEHTRPAPSLSGSASHSDHPLEEVKDSRVSPEIASMPIIIHTEQPSQAKTMTIPGIHASHRGEVMSMGHVAPPAPMTENRTKSPAIQGMYRLWKNHAPDSPPASASAAQGVEIEAQGPDEATRYSGEVRTASIGETDQSVAHDVPPSLPPRLVTADTPHSDRHAFPDTSHLESSSSGRTNAPPSLYLDPSPAPGDVHIESTGAGSIQPHDGNLRISSPPPLPPRRTSVPS